MKKINTLLLVLAMASGLHGFGAEIEEMRSFKSSNNSYTLTNNYNDIVYMDEDDTEAGTITSAFYHNNYIYICQNLGLYAFPLPSAGEKAIAEPVTIEEYEEGVNHLWRFYYFGSTPDGQVYAASYTHTKQSSNSNPFEIFLLSFEKGWDTATVVKGWELPVGPVSSNMDWGPRNPQVVGDLTTGNFTVAAQVWEQSSYKSTLTESQYATKIATWKVTDDEVAEPVWARAVVSPSMVTPLDDNKLLIHDKQYWANINPYFAYSSAPQIVEIQDNHQLKVVSTLNGSCTQLDKHSCGSAIFQNGDDHMIFYHTGIGVDDEDGVSNKMALAQLPDGSSNLSTAHELTTMMSTGNASTSSIQGNESEVGHVSTANLDENTTLMLSIPYSHKNVLGVYTLYRQPKTTGLEQFASQNLPKEYYTIEGIKIEYPTLPGLYIVRQGANVEKIYIR